MRKIHCEEMEKEGFDNILPLKEVKDMIGFYEPVEDKPLENIKWKVTKALGGYFANTQFEAEVISSLEEIKALLLKRGEK